MIFIKACIISEFHAFSGDIGIDILISNPKRTDWKPVTKNFSIGFLKYSNVQKKKIRISSFAFETKS